MDYKITIIAARYHEEIMSRLLKGARKAFLEAGIKDGNIEELRVPGSFEVPIVCEWVAARGGVDAIVALGAIHKGETIHDQVIAHATAKNIQRLSMRTGVPIGFGVMTFQTDEQGMARSADDQHNRGREAALAALEMLKLKLNKLEARS